MFPPLFPLLERSQLACLGHVLPAVSFGFPPTFACRVGTAIELLRSNNPGCGAIGWLSRISLENGIVANLLQSVSQVTFLGRVGTK